MIDFVCPGCGLELEVADRQAGTEQTCPGCGAWLTVPPRKKREDLVRVALSTLTGLVVIILVINAVAYALMRLHDIAENTKKPAAPLRR